MVRHKPFLLAISGIRKTYSRFPASSLHSSLKEAWSNGLRVTIGQDSIIYEPLDFIGSILCSSISTTYHLPIICNRISKIARECEQRNVSLLLRAGALPSFPSPNRNPQVQGSRGANSSREFSRCGREARSIPGRRKNIPQSIGG
jgi:hypothetical protein